MPDQLDYKKKYKDLYLPKAIPVIIDVPQMTFIMADGRGNPNEEGGEFAQAAELLYGLSYVIKMSSKSGKAPAGHFDYVVPPLEGLWESEDGRPTGTIDRDRLVWTAMIRQPEFVLEEVFNWAKAELKKKKPHIDTSPARLQVFTEGLCVQMMHLGPYDTEILTVQAIDDYARSKGYVSAMNAVLPERIVLRHHEIYLSDPRKTDPDKMKTVVRHPIKSRD